MTDAEVLDRNIRKIADLERAALHQRSPGDRLSDRISHLTGSMPFVVVHAVLFLAWIFVNTGNLPVITRLIPFPSTF